MNWIFASGDFEKRKNEFSKKFCEEKEWKIEFQAVILISKVQVNDFLNNFL